jgi:hypothetical protein
MGYKLTLSHRMGEGTGVVYPNDSSVMSVPLSMAARVRRSETTFVIT